MMMSPASLKGDEAGRKPVCSGPYKFVERIQNDRIVLERFADYWDKDSYHFDRVVFTPIPDSTVRLANLQSGDFNLIERVAPSDFAAVEGDAKLKLASVTGLGYQAVEVNIANGARGDTPSARTSACARPSISPSIAKPSPGRRHGRPRTRTTSLPARQLRLQSLLRKQAPRRREGAGAPSRPRVQPACPLKSPMATTR